MAEWWMETKCKEKEEEDDDKEKDEDKDEEEEEGKKACIVVPEGAHYVVKG